MSWRAYIWPELNLEGNSFGWVAKSFIVLRKIHFLFSHRMRTIIRFWKKKQPIFGSILDPNVKNNLMQPPWQAPRLILSPFMSCFGPIIWMYLELCLRIFAILFSSLLIDIIFGGFRWQDLQLTCLRFRRIKGFSARGLGET